MDRSVVENYEMLQALLRRSDGPSLSYRQQACVIRSKMVEVGHGHTSTAMEIIKAPACDYDWLL